MRSLIYCLFIFVISLEAFVVPCIDAGAKKIFQNKWKQAQSTGVPKIAPRNIEQPLTANQPNVISKNDELDISNKHVVEINNELLSEKLTTIHSSNKLPQTATLDKMFLAGEAKSPNVIDDNSNWDIYDGRGPHPILLSSSDEELSDNLEDPLLEESDEDVIQQPQVEHNDKEVDLSHPMTTATSVLTTTEILNSPITELSDTSSSPETEPSEASASLKNVENVESEASSSPTTVMSTETSTLLTTATDETSSPTTTVESEAVSSFSPISRSTDENTNQDQALDGTGPNIERIEEKVPSSFETLTNETSNSPTAEVSETFVSPGTVINETSSPPAVIEDETPATTVPIGSTPIEDENDSSNDVVEAEDYPIERYFIMFAYSIFCIVCLSFNLIRKWLMTPTSKAMPLPVSSHLAADIKNSSKELRDIKERLGINMHSDSRDIRELIRKLEMDKQQLADRVPPKRVLNKLTNEFGDNVTERTRYFTNALQNLQTLCQERNRNSEYKDKIKLFMEFYLCKIQNFVRLEDTLKLMKEMEFDEHLNSLRENISKNKIKSEFLHEQVDIFKSVVVELERVNKLIEKDIAQEEVEDLKLCERIGALREQAKLADESIKRLSRDISSLWSETDEYYKGYINNYYMYVHDFRRAE